MTDCIDESYTCHFRGRWFGFGPVANCENVLFAVFSDTQCDGKRVTADTFDSDQLKRMNHSLARLGRIRMQTFQKRVVAPASTSKGTLVGVAVANTGTLRSLTKSPPNNAGGNRRVICITDRVEAGDFSAHAVIGFAEWTKQLNQKRVKLLREQIRLQLAEVFGEIRPPETLAWASLPGLMKVKVLLLLRNARDLVLKLIRRNPPRASIAG